MGILETPVFNEDRRSVDKGCGRVVPVRPKWSGAYYLYSREMRIEIEMEYIIISVPNSANTNTFEKVHYELFKKHHLCDVVKFSVPQNLRVSTLDALMELSKNLSKLEAFSESVARKFVNYMGEILEDEKSQLGSHLQINKEPLDKYFLHYEWNESRFSSKESLEALFNLFSKKTDDLDLTLKTKMNAYNQIKQSYQVIYRKNHSSLLTRNIFDLVKKEQFVTNSEYLTTLAVVVSKSNEKLWLNEYESLCNFVVPKSAQLIAKDNEYTLWAVTMFKKVVQEFTTQAKLKKFFVKDFEYDEKAIVASKEELENSNDELKESFKNLFAWLKCQTQEAIIYLLHIKSMKIFVESALRYGLPLNFQSILLAPHKKQNNKEIKHQLEKMFGHLDQGLLTHAKLKTNERNEEETIASVLGEPEYFPCVFSKLETNFLSKQH